MTTGAMEWLLEAIGLGGWPTTIAEWAVVMDAYAAAKDKQLAHAVNCFDRNCKQCNELAASKVKP